jgi:hypothetical protein
MLIISFGTQEIVHIELVLSNHQFRILSPAILPRSPQKCYVYYRLFIKIYYFKLFLQVSSNPTQCGICLQTNILQ